MSARPVARVDGSIWRCLVSVQQDGRTEECSAQVEQQDLEEHLRVQHKIRTRNPQRAIEHFVLTRSVLSRGRESRPRVPDQTPAMFEFHEHRVNDVENP